MSERRVLKEVNVGTIKATVLLSDGSEEVISCQGHLFLSRGDIFSRNCEELLKTQIQNNVCFEAESGNSIFGKYIVKIIKKEITDNIKKYNEVYTKLLFFPEQFSYHERVK